MCQPFFSIIIPTYNSERTISKAVSSILSQTVADFEILLIDGASSDQTLHIVQSFSDNRVRIYSEKDEGIFDAMNKGISLSIGCWLLFLGSDDSLFEANTLALVAETIKQNPSSRFVFGDVLTSADVVQRYNNYNYSKLLDKCICHQSIFYHRSLFLSLNYDIKYKICADWDFNLKVFRNRNNPVYIDRPLANFNLGGASNNWRNQPEYITHFSNKNILILRYRSLIYLLFYHTTVMFDRLVFLTKSKTKRLIQNVFTSSSSKA